MTSLPTPESVDERAKLYLQILRDKGDLVHQPERDAIARYIEQQAAEIERLKEENKALGIADAHHFDEYAELKARAEAAEARIVELTEKLAECDDDSFKHVIRQRDEASAQVTALTAENAVLLATLDDLRKTASLLSQNAEGCARNHYGDDFDLHGFPGWLRDCNLSINRAIQALSTPNPKAMRMVEVVKAATAVVREWELHGRKLSATGDLANKLRRLTDGEQ